MLTENLHSNPSLPEAFSMAKQLHNAGALQEAEQYYHHILERTPAHVPALHELGIIKAQLGKPLEAMHIIQQALLFQNDVPILYVHQGHIFRLLHRPEEALTSYNQALKLEPQNSDTLYHQGHVLQELKQYEQALASYDKAIQSHPYFAEAFYSRGNTLRHLQRYEEAFQSYNHALYYQPAYKEALNNRGVLLQAFNHYEEALEDYQQALAIDPEYTESLYNAGRTCLEMQQAEQALPFLEAVLKLQPLNAEAFYSKGHALYQLKSYDEALSCFAQAISLKENYADAIYSQGNVLLAIEKYEAALESFQQVLSLHPQDINTLHQQGVAYYLLKQFDEALAVYQQAIALSPLPDIELLFNYGMVLQAVMQHKLALAQYEAVLAIDPHYLPALLNKGVILREFGHYEEAICVYDEILSYYPDYAEAHYNKGLCELSLGRFKHGWENYEWRLQVKKFQGKLGPAGHYYVSPAWNGKENISGQTILIHVEQGLGDIIQFCRYIECLHKQDAHVILEIPLLLKALLSTLPFPKTIRIIGEAPVHFDHHCSLMSLPFALNTTFSTIPASIPYLFTDSKREKYWQNKLSTAASAVKVGLVWSGSQTHMNDRNRSIPLETLLPLTTLPYQFYSIQKEYRRSDQALLNTSRIQEFSHELQDFADTAALISQLDLIISVDTAVAHLAGALGKSVWILLPYVADWRWLTDQYSSPWYPTARLFRQTQPGNWESVIASIQQSLLHESAFIYST